MTTATEEKTQGSQNANSDDYIQQRRKKKSYVLIAAEDDFDVDLLIDIENYVRNTFKGLSIVRVKTEAELIRYGLRQLNGIFITDNFIGGLEKSLPNLLSLKQKKHDSHLPLIFLTEDPSHLIREYNQILLAYQETDGYLEYRNLERNQMTTRINELLEGKNRRRSRHFKIELDVKIFDFAKDETYPARIIDMSLHGGIIIATQGRIYKANEQFKIHLPISKFLETIHGEFLRLSAKVRSVFLGGDKAAFSWEHISEKQIILLTKLITTLVEVQMRHEREGAKKA